MVHQTRQQIGITPPPVPAKIGLHSSFGAVGLDPHDHVLDRNAVRSAPTGTNQGLLVPAAEFQRFGHGTWLGLRESMKVVPASDGSPADWIFAGSAEGVVTRFVLSQLSGIDPLVAAARSNQAGVDYAPGFGAWALDVGDLDADGDDEVVVAAYRRIAVLDATTLDLQAEVSAPFGTGSDPWLYSRPRSLQIVDFDTASAGAEIVFTTVPGRLVVMDKDLQVIAQHSDAGIIDMVVGPPQTPPFSTTFDRVLSEKSADADRQGSTGGKIVGSRRWLVESAEEDGSPALSPAEFRVAVRTQAAARR